MRLTTIFDPIKTRLQHTSLFQRIAVGNALVIITGAVAGTLITRYLSSQSVDWLLIMLLTLLGVLLSTAINFLIVSVALRPLGDLGRLVKRLQSEADTHQAVPLPDFKHADPYTARMAATLQSLFHHLEERNEELRALSERAIIAQEAERKAIAQSLHDDTGQALTMLAIHLDRIDERIPEDDQELKRHVAEARLLTTNALTELRCILSGLRPSILDDLGLVPAIRWYARTNLEAAGVPVNFTAPGSPVQLPSAVATTLFRIAQEAINNIVRHAHASCADIVLQVTDHEVRLQVEDDGAGFDPKRVSMAAVHVNQLGLVGIRERAQLLGGNVTIESIPGKGSCLVAIIPIKSDGEKESGTDPHLTG